MTSGWVAPAHRETLNLPADGQPLHLEIPEAHRNQNLLVEIESGGIRRSHLHLHNRMSVRLMRDFGQLQARDAETGRPIPKTYVKVYALGQNGLVSFWKDGYTDARGRFDYLTVNHRKPEEAIRFSLLILHPDHGTEIRETTPPTR